MLAARAPVAAAPVAADAAPQEVRHADVRLSLHATVGWFLPPFVY